MSAVEIDDAARKWFVTHPAWIGPVLRGALPETEDPLAVYYSWVHGSQRIPALLVLPSALIGMQIEFVGHSESVLSVTRSAVGLSEVIRVSTSMRTGIDRSGNAYPSDTQSVEVEVRGELPPFGSVISLPLTKNDYRGNWEEWKSASRAVADALVSLGMGTRSGA